MHDDKDGSGQIRRQKGRQIGQRFDTASGGADNNDITLHIG